MRDVWLHGFFSGPAVWEPILGYAQGCPNTSQEQAAPALPFHGGPPAATFTSACAAMWEVLDGSAPSHQPVHLVGYSLGARVALWMACLAPHRVARLTLIGVHPGLADAEARQARQSRDAVWQALLASGPLDAFARAWDAQPLFSPRAALPSPLQQVLQASRAGLDPMALKQSFDVLGLAHMPCALASAPTLTMPVHLIVGGQDAAFIAHHAALAQVLSNASHTRIDGGLHDVVLTHPEAVARAVFAW